MSDTCGVAVFVRFRPVNKREVREQQDGSNGMSAITIDGSSVQVISGGLGMGGNKPLDFHFDAIFDGTSTQGKGRRRGRGGSGVWSGE